MIYCQDVFGGLFIFKGEAILLPFPLIKACPIDFKLSGIIPLVVCYHLEIEASP